MQINTIITPNKKMIFHTNLMIQSFLKNGCVEDYEFYLSVGPHVGNLASLKKICGSKLIINQYYKSKHDFKPPYLGGCQSWDSHTEKEVSLFIDADTIICGSIKEIVNECFVKQKILGVHNIGSPFRFLNEDSRILWDKIGKEFKINFNYIHHQGVNISIPHGFNKKHFYIPNNYFNYGFVLVPKKYKEEIKTEIPSLIKKVINIFGNNFWVGEIAFCLAINKMNIPFEPISLKYNYPDRNEFFENKHEEDIRVLHMVKKTIKNKSDIFKIGEKKVEKFILSKICEFYNSKIFI